VAKRITENHARRLPHRVEDRELRIVYWRTLITSLHVVHVDRFPNRSFGKDLQLIVVYGSLILAYLEGRKPTIATSRGILSCRTKPQGAT
jgi:hypothetical protein